MPKPLENHMPFGEVEEKMKSSFFPEAEELGKKYRSGRGTAPYTHTHTTRRRILWTEVGMEGKERTI